MFKNVCRSYSKISKAKQVQAWLLPTAKAAITEYLAPARNKVPRMKWAGVKEPDAQKVTGKLRNQERLAYSLPQADMNEAQVNYDGMLKLLNRREKVRTTMRKHSSTKFKLNPQRHFGSQTSLTEAMQERAEDRSQLAARDVRMAQMFVTQKAVHINAYGSRLNSPLEDFKSARNQQMKSSTDIREEDLHSISEIIQDLMPISQEVKRMIAVNPMQFTITRKTADIMKYDARSADEESNLMEKYQRLKHEPKYNHYETKLSLMRNTIGIMPNSESYDELTKDKNHIRRPADTRTSTLRYQANRAQYSKQQKMNKNVRANKKRKGHFDFEQEQLNVDGLPASYNDWDEYEAFLERAKRIKKEHNYRFNPKDSRDYENYIAAYVTHEAKRMDAAGNDPTADELDPAKEMANEKYTLMRRKTPSIPKFIIEEPAQQPAPRYTQKAKTKTKTKTNTNTIQPAKLPENNIYKRLTLLMKDYASRQTSFASIVPKLSSPILEDDGAQRNPDTMPTESALASIAKAAFNSRHSRMNHFARFYTR